MELGDVLQRLGCGDKGFTDIDLSQQDITDATLEQVVKLLRTHGQIRWLSLSMNSFSSVGMRHIAHACRRNQMISHLVLSHNDIDLKGMHMLGHGLKESPSLTFLDLAQCNIRDETMAPLCAWLGRSSLETLILEGNHVSCEGAALLANALEANGALSEVDLAGNVVSDDGLCALSRAILGSTSLTSLDLSGNEITAQAVATLCTALRANTSLDYISMAMNVDIALVDVVAMQNMVRCNAARRRWIQEAGTTLVLCARTHSTPLSPLPSELMHLLFACVRLNAPAISPPASH
eukprot:TRINITY_DN4256_c0_g1_i2.p1 TRINITY_DN4256_c0_g1~~TRINITY_DN4256_c0_g1_i2.p1  ORF type:complete len:292 (-),score=62.46 TRINITY_DN4256_c0_g1_i2:121-996(-)